MEIDKIVDKILEELGISYTDTITTRNNLLISDIIHCLVVTRTIKETADLLGMGESGLEHLLHRHLKPLINKTTKEKWDYWLLGLVDLRRCPECLEILELDKFSSTSMYISKCLKCDNIRSKHFRHKDLESARARSLSHYYRNRNYYIAKNSARKAAKLNRTPIWADLEKIKSIYLNCPEGYHVDHIIPLQGNIVSGFHIETNLQYLLAADNLVKGNKFENKDLRE